MSRFLTIDLLWKLSKVSRIVLILVVDDMPVRLVGLNALRRQCEQITDHDNILFSVSVQEYFRPVLRYQYASKETVYMTCCSIMSEGRNIYRWSERSNSKAGQKVPGH